MMEACVFTVDKNIMFSARDFAACEGCLLEHSIAAVLTVDSEPLVFTRCPKHTNHEGEWKGEHLYVQTSDTCTFNLLDRLEECLKFLEGHEKRKTLVHCLAGQSRSVSVVLAFVMRSKQVPVKQAFQGVQAINPQAQPNGGFMKQLSLFEQMGYVVDENHPLYRSFVTKLEQNTLVGTHDNDVMNKVNLEREKIFKCRVCRTELTNSLELGEPHGSKCSSIHLIEPPDWLREQMQTSIQGKIMCFKCAAKLGAYNWAGITCSCGKWVTPSFQINLAKVDVQMIRT